MPIPDYSLKDLRLSPDQLLLWPNNPRLKISSFAETQYTTRELKHPQVQGKLLELMRANEHDVASLIDSIRTQGYLNIYSIIVTSVGGGKYLVLEGNRRTTAIKSCLEEAAQLDEEILATLKSVPAKEFVCDSDDDLLQIYNLLARMHIAGPKEWTPIQQAHVVYQSYVSILKREDGLPFRYQSKQVKRCARELSLVPNEVGKDLRIYRIFTQLQSSNYPVQHEHYSKIRMCVETPSFLSNYLCFDGDLCLLQEDGMDRFFELFIDESCAIRNPQDFTKLKAVFKHGGIPAVERVRRDGGSLEEVHSEAKNIKSKNAFLTNVKRANHILCHTRIEDFNGSNDEIVCVEELLELAERFHRLAEGRGSRETTKMDIARAVVDDRELIEPIDVAHRKIVGALSTESMLDDRYDEDYYYEDYMVSESSLKLGTVVQVDLLSDEFDAFLSVLSPDDLDNDIAYDDNSGEGSNARLIIDFSEHKYLTVRVTSADVAETGKYELVYTRISS